MLSKPKPNKKRKLPEKAGPNQLTLDGFGIKGKAPMRARPKTVIKEPEQIQPEPMDEDNPTTRHVVTMGVRLSSILPTNYKIIRNTPVALEESFESNWEKLQTLIQCILSDTDCDVGYVTATRMCENICVYGDEEDLFNKVVSVLQSFTAGLFENLDNINESTDNFLESLNAGWKSYRSHLNTLSVIFCQLDRGYILPKTTYNSLISLGKNIFSETIIKPKLFRMRTINALLKLIIADRVSDISSENKSLLQELLEMLSDLSYYSSDFEVKFLENTNGYYKQEAAKQIRKLTPPEYIDYAQKCLDDESSSRKSYLSLDTKKKSAEVVVKQLVLTSAQKIIDLGFNAMMEADMTEPLASLYGMLRPYPDLISLRIAFEKYIKSEGEELIKYPADDATMIQSLIEFKGNLDNILNICFKGDPSFSNGLKESFEYFINKRGNKPAELLSKFIDQKIKSSAKQSDDVSNQNMSLLNNSVNLFRYIHGKDAFELYYKRSLSRRLLLNRSISIELESDVLEKLKAECGEDYTKNLESMINDIRISSEMTATFSDMSKEMVGFAISVNVISQEVWPTYPNTNLILPENMNNVLQRYNEFYSKRFNGRNLTWQKNLSSCVIRGNFPKGQKTIHASLAHCVILLLFNNKLSMSIQDIESATGLDKTELMRVLKSLSSGNTSLLLKQSNDYFAYNSKFEAPNTNLRINLTSADQTISEERDVEADVAKDRQLQLDAAIVRLMKNKKTMTHSELMADIFNEVKYAIEANDIKKRIETLIDKGYLARDQTDSSVYNYLS